MAPSWREVFEALDRDAASYTAEGYEYHKVRLERYCDNLKYAMKLTKEVAMKVKELQNMIREIDRLAPRCSVRLEAVHEGPTLDW